MSSPGTPAIADQQPFDLDAQFYQKFQLLNGNATKENMLSVMREVGFIGNMGGERDRLIQKYNLFSDSQQRQKPTTNGYQPQKPPRSKRKEATPAQKRCKEAVGFSLDYPNITPNAIPILMNVSQKAMILYMLFCGYMDTFRSTTKPRSRKAWAALADIKSKSTWKRLEKELLDNRLIKRHKDDKHGDYEKEQEIRFVLPLAKAYRQM